MVVNRVICVGDVHGDFKVFKKTLKMCGLINNKDYWIGGDTYLVQLGDTLDGKRPDTKINSKFLKETGEIEIMTFILCLDAQAKIQGGRAISILGNHELYPYYLKNDKDFIKGFVKQSDIKQYKKIFDSDRIKFFLPGGIGASLFARTRPLLYKVGKFIFVHGSLTDLLIDAGMNGNFVDIDKINHETSEWLSGRSKKIPVYLKDMNDDNPVFCRFYSSSKELSEEKCAKISQQLEKFKGVEYVIMGHSPFKQINTACNGSLIRTDVALSRAFGGNLYSKKLQVLEIINPSGNNPELNIIVNGKKVKMQA